MTRKTTTKKPSQLDRIETKLGAMDAFVSTTLPAMFNEFRTMESKLDLLLKGSDFMKEIGEKEEPWKVGDLAKVSEKDWSAIHRGMVLPVMKIIDKCAFLGPYPGSFMLDVLERPSPAEVQKYEEQVKAQEWAKVDELQDWDACECTKSEQADLWAMGSAFAYHANSDSLNLRWDPDYGRTKLVKTSRPDQFSPKHPLNWIPVAEFRRRLEGTISKRKAQEQEAKIEHWRKTTLNWPQLVKYAGRDAIVRSHHDKVGANNNNGMGWVSLIFKEGDTNCVSPMDLTLIDP